MRVISPQVGRAFVATLSFSVGASVGLRKAPASPGGRGWERPRAILIQKGGHFFSAHFSTECLVGLWWLRPSRWKVPVPVPVPGESESESEVVPESCAVPFSSAVIRAGTKAAEGLSTADLAKRARVSELQPDSGKREPLRRCADWVQPSSPSITGRLVAPKGSIWLRKLE